jgi:formylmethanofuran dehydrogenase subunit E
MKQLLAASAAMHQHLCPRQVLGVRAGMEAGRLLGLDLPQKDKRLLTLVETDGCFADGVAVAAGCWVGRRTLRVLDFGKVAATFVDTQTGRAVRIIPRATSRRRAAAYAPETTERWEAYLLGYQRMPIAELLETQAVTLTLSLEKLLSREGCLALCEICGEEIINEREIEHEGTILCRGCAGQRYYRRLDEDHLSLSMDLLRCFSLGQL